MRKGEEAAMRILVAVDGSDQSLNAVRAVDHLAHAEQVIALHAVDVPRLAYPIGGEPAILEDFSLSIAQSMQEEGERLLDRVTSLLLMDKGTLSKRLEKGAPADVILTAAVKEKADLIVLGSRGLGPVKELLLGSVSHRVVTHAPCSTLVVNRPLRSLRRIMLAVQGPEDAAPIKKFLATKPFREAVEIMVVTVLPVTQSLLPAGFSKMDALAERTVREGRTFVEGMASDLSALGFSAKGYVLMGAPALALLQEAEASNPDLIMLRARSRPEISRFLLGSVSHTVLHRSPCPTLIVR
jgi:nucleotide-binding universal stress UspA family protein